MKLRKSGLDQLWTLTNFTVICNPLPPVARFPPTTFIPDLDEAITHTELLQVIKKLKSGKSAGEDGIPVEVYKTLPDQVLHLTSI